MGTGKSTQSRERSTRHKCLYCNDLFTPDPRNRHRHHYCSKPACRHASKKASQKRWLSSKKGAGYFSGSFNVARVQEWRRRHPDYWKKTSSRPEIPLQDILNPEPIDNKDIAKVEDLLLQNALQDISFLQPALFIGLIASLTGSTLQDDIAQTTRRFIDSGRDILCNATPPTAH